MIFTVFVRWIRGTGVKFESEGLGIICVEVAIEFEEVQVVNAVHQREDFIHGISKVFVCGIKVGIVCQRALVEGNLLPKVYIVCSFPTVTGFLYECIWYLGADTTLKSNI